MSRTVTCRSCGAANDADDQFCGVCGTALAAGDSGATTDPDASPAIVDGGPPAATPLPPPAAPVSGPTRACGVCGAANEVSRTFCRVCGSTLVPMAAAGGVAQGPARSEREQRQVRPAPARGTRPADAARPAPPAGARPAAAAVPRRGGGGWLLVLAALGVLLGILIVILPSLLGSRPVTEAEPSHPAASDSLPEAAVPTDVRLVVLPLPVVVTILEPTR